MVCPICASFPGGDPNHVTDDFQGHLNLEHRWAPAGRAAPQLPAADQFCRSYFLLWGANYIFPVTTADSPLGKNSTSLLV